MPSALISAYTYESMIDLEQINRVLDSFEIKFYHLGFFSQILSKYSYSTL